MTITVEILSGLHRKAPAAILLTAGSQRILMDAGSGLECDDAPWTLPSDLDAVLISHDHVDHIGGLSRLPAGTPVYCTAVTARALPSHLTLHTVPVRGTFSLGEWTVTTGSSGHAYGGIWFHIDVPGGLFYSGDISLESTFFHFDIPPAAQLALIDASYGLYDTPLSQQQDAFLSALPQPMLCPVPPSGRTAEMALLAFKHPAVSLTFDEDCRSALTEMARHNDGTLTPDCQPALNEVLATSPTLDPTRTLIFAADPDGDTGTAGALRAQPRFTHRVVFTGHMTAHAHQQWQNGELEFYRWNVHPTRQGLQQLMGYLGCKRCVPLFTSLHDLVQWQQALGCQIVTHSTIELTT